MASSDSIETQDARSRAAPDERWSLLVLEDDSHARITVKEGETWIADLDSHNGIRVNGLSVRGPQLLQ